MNAAIFVPYSPSPLREEPLRRVKEYLAAAAPWPVVMCESKTIPYPFGKSINQAVAASEVDMVLRNDADTITPLEQMLEAVRLAAAEPGLVFAFTHYVRLDEHGQRDRVLVRPPAHSFAAISRECWDFLGGYNEGFVGWGMEDREFNRRAERLWPIRRVPGEVVHFWHGDRRRDDSTLETPPEVVAANWAHLKATA